MKLSEEETMSKIPVGVQLYSIREDCARDLPGSLAAVAKMGYAGVEFAGYHGYSAQELRKMLDDNGLKCCGTHIGLDSLLGDALEQTVEFNKILGNRYLIVPGLAHNRTSSRAAWLETGSIFNEIAEKLLPHGMVTGYHNHHTEFTPLEGELPWDTFFSNTRPEVVMQFDTGNALFGGGDAIPFLERYPGRALTVHLKPFSRSAAKDNPEDGFKPLIGEDEIPWSEIFRLCETTGKTEWYIVEYESDAHPPLKSIELCLDALRRMGKL